MDESNSEAGMKDKDAQDENSGASLSATASVKMMLTRAEKQALRDLGYSDEAISHMTPDGGAGIVARREVSRKAEGQAATQDGGTNQSAEVVHLRPPKPELQKPNIDGEPTHPAKSAPYWLMWRAEQPRPGKQKWRKVPYIAQAGKPVAASSTDPLTWRTYDQAVQTYRMSQNWPRPYDGIGLVFDGAVGDDGLCFCGIDLDA